MADVPSFRLYNTLTRQVEPVRLQEPGHLRFYSCGPTVYSYAHIGNFRTFITADLIVRVAQAIGWQTTYVSNITDVGHLTEDDVADASGEDRMARALSSKEGERFANVWDLARYYADVLLEDWQTLNLRRPDVQPRATEHMRDQIQAVEKLLAAGHAYETDQGIYFSVASFPGYGRLSGNEAADQLEETVREVVTDAGKRDPRDFALWKKDDKHLMQWYSPWGWGFPGWHIECSVMAQAYLGDTLDLHAGGEDLIFPHHECEIAQAESLTGQPFANHWAHTRFLKVEGEKMSKRTGNFFTVRDLVTPVSEGGRGIDPLALRLTLLSGHYRKPYNFTFKTLQASRKHVDRLREAEALLLKAQAAAAPGDDRIGSRLEGLYDRVLAALCDDLNTPEAIAAVLQGVKLIHGMGAHLNAASAEAGLAWLDQVNGLLGILRHEAAPAQSKAPAADDLTEEEQQLFDGRNAARSAKDWARADALRDALLERGIEIRDTPDGATWKRTR